MLPPTDTRSRIGFQGAVGTTGFRVTETTEPRCPGGLFGA